jgi:hypothetical protein
VKIAGAFPANPGSDTSCGGGQVLSYSDGQLVCVTLSNTADGQVSVTTVGVPGPMGATGATGATSVNGVPGADGTNGASGGVGASGTVGTTGAQGTQGVMGATGATGAAGVLSASLSGGLSGSVLGGVLNVSLVTASGGGLSTTANGLSLTTSCTSGQILSWNGTSWGCESISGGGGAPTTCSNTYSYACNGGNELGAPLDLGTIDNNALNLETSGSSRFAIGSNASTLTGQGATTINSTTSLTLVSSSSNTVSLDSGTTGAVNIGTGAYAKTITFGNSTGGTSLIENSGTGGTTNSSTTTTSNAYTLNANNLTTGTGLFINSSSSTNMTGELAAINFSGNDASNTGSLLSLSSTGTSNSVAGLKINILGNGLALDVTGGVAFRSGAVYAATGTQDNVNLGNASTFELNPSAQLTLDGLAGGSDGRIMTLINVSNSVVTLAEQNTGSSAVNRIETGTGGAAILSPGMSALLEYETVNDRWHVISSGTSTPAYGSTVISSFPSFATTLAWTPFLSTTVPSAGAWQVCYSGNFSSDNNQTEVRLYNEATASLVANSSSLLPYNVSNPVYDCSDITTTGSATIDLQYYQTASGTIGFSYNTTAPSGTSAAPLAPFISYTQLQ